MYSIYMTDCIKIQIPASSSNLGAGFDCFGLALDLYNEYIFNFTSSGFKANSNLDENIFVIFIKNSAKIKCPELI
jgi:homoserine kinase